MPPAPGAVVRALSERPSTPLSDAALLTNAHGEPGVGHEIRAELASADRVDVIMAFVKWYGLRLFEDRLKTARERGVPLRLITTTYMGATERAALDRLVRDFGAEVKVQYDAQRTRLHAKAWLFRRNTGFDTAYVGSSNLSRAAMLDGVEWNVRLSSVATPPCCRSSAPRSTATGTTPTFESYDPDADRDRLDDALAEAAGQAHQRQGDPDALRPRGAAVPLPTGDARPARGRASRARPSPEPPGGGDWHRQDGCCCPRLPAPGRRCPDASGTALRRAPAGDPPAVPAHLPRGSRRRELRRALRGRSSPRAMGARLRFRAVTVGVRHHEHPGGGVSSRRHRRVPPRRGEDLPTDPRSPQPAGAAWPDSHPRTRRRPGRAGVLRRPHRGRAAPVGRPQGRPADAVPLLRRRRRHGHDPRRLEGRRLRHGRAVESVHRQRRSRPHRPQGRSRQGRRPHCHEGAGLLCLPGPCALHDPGLQRRRDQSGDGARRHRVR